MIVSQISPGTLVPFGKALLMGSFAVTLIRAMRNGGELQVGFERLVIGFLALVFFENAAVTLESLSEQLSHAIHRLGDEDDLKKLILEAFQNASDEGKTPGGG